jgi:hypothetical protein
MGVSDTSAPLCAKNGFILLGYIFCTTGVYLTYSWGIFSILVACIFCNWGVFSVLNWEVALSSNFGGGRRQNSNKFKLYIHFTEFEQMQTFTFIQSCATKL